MSCFCGFPCNVLDPVAPTILLPSLQWDSLSLAKRLALGLCICFHQLLDEGSLMTTEVVTNLIIGDGQFRLGIHSC